MTLDEVIQQPGMRERMLSNSLMQSLHVSLPGTVVSYDSDKRTVNVQPAIRPNNSTVLPPMLLDVPVFFPGNLLFPVNVGDECLVVFSDRCMDEWFANGGVNVASLSRMHDLSDGFAFVGFSSLPNTSKGFDLVEKLNDILDRLDGIDETLEDHEERITTLEEGGEDDEVPTD